MIILMPITLFICITVIIYKWLDNSEMGLNTYRIRETEKNISYLAEKINGIEAMQKIILHNIENNK